MPSKSYSLVLIVMVLTTRRNIHTYTHIYTFIHTYKHTYTHTHIHMHHKHMHLPPVTTQLGIAEAVSFILRPMDQILMFSGAADTKFFHTRNLLSRRIIKKKRITQIFHLKFLSVRHNEEALFDQTFIFFLTNLNYAYPGRTPTTFDQ